MKERRYRRLAAVWVALGLSSASYAQSTSTAWVRHAPTLNGTVEGSVQMMAGENIVLSGSATMTGDLLVPGVPTVRRDGSPAYGGIVDGTGSVAPSGYEITLKGNCTLRHVVRRVDPMTLPGVSPPPAPTGTRSVALNSTGQTPGDFATLRNLALTGNAGSVAVPPGTYGDLAAAAGNGFVLGLAGSTQPARYCLQHLTIDGNAWIDLAGPVELIVAEGLFLNGKVGSPGKPGWLQLKVAAGGVTLSGGSALFGRVQAPTGAVMIKGGSQLVGTLACDRLTLEGNGLLRLTAVNQPPTVALTSPVDGAIFFAPASFSLTAVASDIDGTISKVEFFQGATKLGESGVAPYQCAVTNLEGGLYAFTARACDDLGASTDSAPVHITVKQPNLPLVVALTSPADNAVVAAPATINLAATTTGGSGVARVGFYSGPDRLGEVYSPPYALAWPGVVSGDYTLVAVATDDGGQIAKSAPIALHVRQGLPYQADFELNAGYIAGSLTGQNGWTASSSVVVSNLAAYSNVLGVLLPAAMEPAKIEHDFASAPPNQPIVFVDFFARPVAGEAPAGSVAFAMGGARVAFVKNGDQGEFYVFNGDGGDGGNWQRVEYNYTVNVSTRGVAAWFPEFSLRFDLVARTWDFFVDGCMLAADVGLAGTGSVWAPRFTLYGHSTESVAFDLFSIGFDNLAFADADKDGMDDGWESRSGLDPTVNDRDGDPDHDQLTNVHEFIADTNPQDADTDKDGLSDGFEVQYHFDPWSYTYPTDDDEDGLTQIQEAVLGTDPNDYFNGETPVITLLSGENSPTGELVVKVHRPDGTAYMNAPVTFSVPDDTACFATNPESTFTHQSLRLRTDGDGLARIYLRPVVVPTAQ